MAPDISTLSPQEIASMFSSEFSDMKSRVRERLAFLPRINLTVPKTTWKEKKGVAIGDWYLTPGDTAQGEEPKYENLGTAFECIVLSDAMQLSMRDEETGRMLIESTEFQNFSGDPIFLLDGRTGPMHVAAVAPYSGRSELTISKLRKDAAWPTKMAKDGKTAVSAIGLDFNVYVLLTDGRLAVLNNTKRGHFGTDAETGETCEFASLAPDSFLRIRALCHAVTPGLTLAHSLEIGSTQVGGGSDEPRPAFGVLGLNDPSEMQEIRTAAQNLQKYLQQKWTDKIGYAWSNTSPAQRSQLITAYADIHELLDVLGGNEVAAQMTLGKKAAPAFLAAPDPEMEAMEKRSKEETAKKIAELETGVQDEELPAVEAHGGYRQTVDVSSLPF